MLSADAEERRPAARERVENGRPPSHLTMVVLSLVAGKPDSAYGIEQRLNDRLPGANARQTLAAKSLKTLLQRGLVRRRDSDARPSAPREPSRHPRAVIWEATDVGRAELERWLLSPLESFEVREELLSRVVACLSPRYLPQLTACAAHAQLVCQERVKEIQAQAPPPERWPPSGGQTPLNLGGVLEMVRREGELPLWEGRMRACARMRLLLEGLADVRISDQ
jgi:DNA-binding PadR family transcriptional regulator